MKPAPAPRWVVTAEQTRAYGLFRAEVTRPDGARFEGWGLTALQAELRARLQAGER